MPLPLFIGIAAAAAAGTKVVKGELEKAKTINALLEEAEARCAKEALAGKVPRTETDLQNKMFALLFKHGFSDSDKSEAPPISSDWKHLPKHVRCNTCKKYSTFSWNEYAFYTYEAVYYHNKKKGIHEFLFYNNINSFDEATETVDYGSRHEKRDISQWQNFEKKFIKQIAHIWKMADETDTSVLEFCFHACRDFEMDLCYFKTGAIQTPFLRQSKEMPETLRQNWKHIKITKMSEGKIELQFWAYFPKVETVIANEGDSEWEIEWKQRQLEQEAKKRERQAHRSHQNLTKMSDSIAELFQKALYDLFGVLFEKENVAFLDEPDFTYEGPSFYDKVQGAVGTAQGVYGKMEEITSRRMADAEREYNRTHKK